MFKNEISTTQSYVLSKKEKKDLSKRLNQLYNVENIAHIMNKFPELYIFKTNCTSISHLLNLTCDQKKYILSTYPFFIIYFTKYIFCT